MNYEDFFIKVRKNIKRLRLEKGLSQEAMEDFSKNSIAYRSYQDIELGNSENPKLESIFKIAMLLGVTPSELLNVKLK